MSLFADSYLHMMHFFEGPVGVVLSSLTNIVSNVTVAADMKSRYSGFYQQEVEEQDDGG